MAIGTFKGSRSLLTLVLVGVSACGGYNGRLNEAPADTGFVVRGDPEATTGAPWTFRGTVDGVRFDLAGVLYKPHGAGPFPAVLLSHGFDGSGAMLAHILAPTMVSWGLVCIAVNYTHSTGVPLGAPGGTREVGASTANVQRAYMTFLLLRRLGYVDMSRVAVHGHSMGAYLDVALLASVPTAFRVASHTGGGVRPRAVFAGPAPTVAEAARIRTPYQMHHGDADATVPLSYDQRMDSVLTAAGVDHELVVHPGADHLSVRASALTLKKIHDWYAAHGMFSGATPP